MNVKEWRDKSRPTTVPVGPDSSGHGASSSHARIESLSHEGRGIARIDGKTVFIDGALPGEEVDFRYLKKHGRFDEGTVVEVKSPSKDRVEPPCEYAGRCGGCSLQHLAPAAQRLHKQSILIEKLRHGARVEPRSILPPISGADLGYRRKARLGVKYVGERGRAVVGFREKHSRLIADIGRCLVLHPKIGLETGALAALVGSLGIRAAIPQIEAAISEGETALVFRHLRPPSPADVERLREFEGAHGLRVYLQPGGEDSINPLTPGPDADLHYTLPDAGLRFRFGPTQFTQVNFEVNALLVRRVVELLEPAATGAVLDLYCGIGNFSLAVAQRAGRVTGVEGDAGLVERARGNAAANSIANTEFIRANLADPELRLEFMNRHWDAVLLDPPRTGAKEILSRLQLAATRRLVYVSCNPATLARDAAILVREKGFTLDQAGIVDMFPHTAHIESIAIFTRPA
jgi:23S rRNA (uracil1939-C5)-methyltransferase